jgi:hypothetical protein
VGYIIRDVLVSARSVDVIMCDGGYATPVSAQDGITQSTMYRMMSGGRKGWGVLGDMLC